MSLFLVCHSMRFCQSRSIKFQYNITVQLILVTTNHTEINPIKLKNGESVPFKNIDHRSVGGGVKLFSLSLSVLAAKPTHPCMP